MDNVGPKVFASALWMMSAQWVERFFGIISMVILARLLLPDDYGMAALAQVVVLFFQIILSDGTEAYLIRKNSASEEDYNTAWSVRVLLFLFIGLLLFMTNEWIAELMDEPRLIDVLYVSALSTIITGFRNVGIIKLTKELNYRPLFYIKFLQKLVAFVVTLSIAFIYKNYWALVIGLLAMECANVLLSYIYCAYRPKFTLQALAEQWSFTKWLFIGNITVFIRNKAITLLIPKYIGAGALGMYAMAYQLANMLAELVILPILAPTLASYTSVRDDKNQFSDRVTKVLSVVSIILIPSYLGLYILSEEILLLVLGDNWLNISPIFQMLLLFVFLQTYISAFTTILTSIGQVKLLAIVNWVLVIILLPTLIYVVINHGLEDAVLYRTVLAGLFALIFLLMVFKTVWLDWPKLIFSLIRPAIAATIMAIVLASLHSVTGPHSFSIVLLVLIGAIIYSICLVFIWSFYGRPLGGEAYILDKMLLVVKKVKILNCLIPVFTRLLK